MSNLPAKRLRLGFPEADERNTANFNAMYAGDLSTFVERTVKEYKESTERLDQVAALLKEMTIDHESKVKELTKMCSVLNVEYQ